MKIGYEYIDKQNSAIEKEGYYLTVNGQAVITESIVKTLRISYVQYKNIALSCNAIQIDWIKYHYSIFIFSTKDDIECAITTLKLLI